MKNYLFYVMLALAFTSCTAIRKTSSAPSGENPAASRDPQFLESISTQNARVAGPKAVMPARKVPENNTFDDAAIEFANPLQFKYAILMNLPVEQVANKKLIDFLEEWYGTPYQFGGTDHDGIDCSAFTCAMGSSVFGYSLPRNSREQYQYCKRISADEMLPGDLVFFSTRGRISHVGVYLGNNKFAHASTSSGVMISDLDEEYFKKRWAGAGRVEGD